MRLKNALTFRWLAYDENIIGIKIYKNYIIHSLKL